MEKMKSLWQHGPARAGLNRWPWRLIQRVGVAWFWLALSLAAGAAPSFTATLDRTTITVEETATLELIFQDLTAPGPMNIQVPKGLEAQYAGERHESRYENGASSAKTTYTYQLSPANPGDYTIPGYQITIAGKNYSSRPLTLKVQPRGTRTGAAEKSEVAFLRLNVPKTALYAGETIPVEIQLYAQGSIRCDYPTIKSLGFILGTNATPQQGNTAFQGKAYNYVFFSLPATAMSAGATNFGPAEINALCVVPTGRYYRDLFNTPETAEKKYHLFSDPVPVQVLPLPATNVPASFNGTVGIYEMSAAAGPTNVAAGDPITLKVQLSGEGNLNTLDMPALNLGSEFKVYPPIIKSQVTDGIGLKGTKTFEYVIIPQTPDVRQIPGFEVSFFDPGQKCYRRLEQPPKDIIVRPAGSAVPPPSLAGSEGKDKKAEQVQDIANIKTRAGHLRRPAKPLAWRPWFLGLQLVPLAGIGVALARLLLRRHKERNPRWVRQREVNRWVEKTLVELKKLAAAGEPEAFYATVFRLLQEQLGERLDMPAQSITAAVVDDVLAPGGMTPETLARLRTLFDRCDQARYAPSGSSADLVEFLAQVNTAIGALRQFTPQRGARAVRKVAALLAVLFVSAQTRAASEFDQGNAAYAEGKFNAAITNYEALVKQNQISPALYFNLGNACFKTGQVGMAIAYYRLAHELAPRDTDVFNNLQMARLRANATLPYQPPWWRAWTRPLTLNEWTLAAMAAGWALAGMIMVSLWKAQTGPGLSKGMRWVGVLFTVIVAGLALRLWEYAGPPPAVVIAKDLPVRYGPLEESRSAFVLGDGSEVEVTDRQGEWLQVRDSLRRTGWLRKSFVLVLR